MKKYVVKLGGYELKLNLQDFYDFGKWRWSLFATWANRLGFAIALIASVLLPWQVLSFSGYDSANIYTLLVAVVIMLACWGVMFALAGSKFVIDPPLFIPVLLFALLTTTAFLLSPADFLNPGSPRNTFGVAGARFTAAIGVIAFISVYYFFNSFVNNRNRVTLFTRGLIVSIAAVMVVLGGLLVFSLDNLLSPQLNALLLLAEVWVPFGLVVFLFRPGRGLVKLGVLASVLIAGFLSLHLANVLWTKLVSVLVLAVLFGWYVRNSAPAWKKQFDYAISHIREVLRGELEVQKYVKETTAVIFAAGLVVWSVGVLAYIFVDRVDIVGGAMAFRPLINQVTSAATSAQSILFGIGVQGSSVANTFLEILRSQGVIGLAGYLVVTISAIRFTWQRAKQELKDKKSNFFYLSLLPVILTVPLMALVMRVNTLLVATWWIALAIITANHLVSYRKLGLDVINFSKVKNKWLRRLLPVAQLAVVFLILLAGVTLLQLVADLFMRGSI
ncbi:MAG: hypothetical protein JNK26_05325 [Candidatus Doudnabacteria bacterium]|nr:hypothetical protein [Candidatus Doudnabacteria bacterium]